MAGNPCTVLMAGKRLPLGLRKVIIKQSEAAMSQRICVFSPKNQLDFTPWTKLLQIPMTIVLSKPNLFCMVFKSRHRLTGHWERMRALHAFANNLLKTVPYLYVVHYNDVIMRAMASQITSLAIVYSTASSSTDERKHQAPRHWPLWRDRWIPRTKG